MELSELVSADTFVLSVSATDRDSGPNGKITYRLLSSPLQGFYMEPENGKNSLTDGKDILQCLIDCKPSLYVYMGPIFCVYIENGEVKKSLEG